MADVANSKIAIAVISLNTEWDAGVIDCDLSVLIVSVIDNVVVFMVISYWLVNVTIGIILPVL